VRDVVLEIIKELLKRMIVVVLVALPLASRAEGETDPAAEREASEFLASYFANEKKEQEQTAGLRLRRVKDCYRFQSAGLLRDHEDCVETLDNAGLLERDGEGSDE